MEDPKAITVGIDARAADEVAAGRGRVVRELLRALAARPDDAHRYVLYTRTAWQGAALDERFRWRPIAARDPAWHLLTARAANRECDVFLSSNSYLTVWFLRIPAVPIIHDLVAFQPAMRARRRSALVERLTLGTAVRRATAFLAVSQATADALASRFPSTASRTVVAHLGVSGLDARALTASEAAALPSPGFVLAVGTLEPRKNLPRLVAAYRALDRGVQTVHPLVVVGAVGWDSNQTLAALRSLGERCSILGHVSDAALGELYRRCAVFCYPSLGEGFGLPVLEAMASGAPVLTSSVSSLPEVGGAAVEYVDPLDVARISAGLRTLLADESLRARLSQAGRERASEFSWSRFAARVLAVLDSASSSGRR